MVLVLAVCILIILFRWMVRPDPRDHGSWQIMTENIMLMPGLSVIGPLFGSPENPGLATFCHWAIIIISGAAYALPLFVVWSLLRLGLTKGNSSAEAGSAGNGRSTGARP